MFGPSASSATPLIARAARSERLTFPGGSTMTLLADSPATGGKLSVHHTMLRDGADGGNPHHHTAMVEVLYILRGQLHVLLGDELTEAGAGDLIIVPPGVTHAFAAAPGRDAELLVAVTPGIERFPLFRRFEQTGAGQVPADVIADQSRYDTYPDFSTTWHQARTVTVTADATQEKPR